MKLIRFVKRSAPKPGIAADVRRKLSHGLSIALEPCMKLALTGLGTRAERDFQVASVAGAPQRPAACQSPAQASGLPKKGAGSPLFVEESRLFTGVIQRDETEWRKTTGKNIHPFAGPPDTQKRAGFLRQARPQKRILSRTTDRRSPERALFSGSL